MMRWWRSRRAAPPLAVVDAYARWAPGCAAEAHNPLLPPVVERRMLALACGSGRYLAHLVGQGAARYGDPAQAAMFAATGVAAALVQVDGRPKLLARPRAQRLRRLGVAEPGLVTHAH